ncbi:hypothetical protein QBC35DRAFT_67682 [Podospora australis]|uniref:MARVEL domain-containing protein n=1 Tax=Podospora australis TaxID=1536484 RepID=A0AAN7AEY0_9PEZI|nr:hypothetical protein QBC35DRAFT_67682 [Podospora australis]
MSDVKVEPQYGVAPAPAAAVSTNAYVQETPVWMVVIRVIQAVLALGIVGMCGWLMHGKVLDAQAFGLVCGLFTWIVVGYTLITEKAQGARGAYNIWAVMSLDLLLAIFWLASLGTNAATRAEFNSKVLVSGCSSDGSAFNAHSCNVLKNRGLADGAVAGDGALAIMSAVAGLSALEWLLFVGTLIFHGHTFRLWYQANKKPSADNANVELNAQGAPMLASQPAVAPQYTGAQQQYQQQYYPQQQPQPQPQQPAYLQAAEVPGNYQQYQQQVPYVPTPVATPSPQVYPQQTGYQQQPPYNPSPAGTPAQGQPYYPPQQ